MAVPSEVTLGPLLQFIVSNDPRWLHEDRDKFPGSQEWADEAEGILSHWQSHGQWERFLPRLAGSSKDRDAALSEGRSSQFLESLGFSIVSWEPQGEGNHIGEFEIGQAGAPAIFVEVKGPGWESELTPAEQKGERKKKPKHVHAEFRAVGTHQKILYAAEKAQPKFTDSRPNLLVVADDLFLSPSGVPLGIFRKQIGDRLSDAKYDRVGAILCLSKERPSGGDIAYKCRFIENPRAEGQQWALPADVAKQLRGLEDTSEN